MPDGTIPSLAAAHLRLGRAAVGIYAAAAAVALSLLALSLYTEHSHTQEQLRKQVLLQAEDRAHALQLHLELLSRELRRLGLRSEVDLFDQDLEPERSLLGVSHGSSTFFNLGVAILNVNGAVVWAEPKRFLPVGQSFAGVGWFTGLPSSSAPPSMHAVEHAYVMRVLEHLEGRRTAAAQALGISYPTFLKRLRELGIASE